MLVLAKPRLENGEEDWSSSEGQQSDADEPLPPAGQSTRLRPGGVDSLRRTEDMDLTGSFSARDRRREKQVGCCVIRQKLDRVTG